MVIELSTYNSVCIFGEIYAEGLTLDSSSQMSHNPRTVSILPVELTLHTYMVYDMARHGLQYNRWASTIFCETRILSSKRSSGPCCHFSSFLTDCIAFIRDSESLTKLPVNANSVIFAFIEISPRNPYSPTRTPLTLQHMWSVTSTVTHLGVDFCPENCCFIHYSLVR
jgi:hypothetical protein